MSYAVELRFRIRHADAVEFARLCRLYPNNPEVQARLRQEQAQQKPQTGL
jgi:hypothetical protein